eukprot:1215912-Amorphochlora_amoeboformis.AAC.1
MSLSKDALLEPTEAAGQIRGYGAGSAAQGTTSSWVVIRRGVSGHSQSRTGVLALPHAFQLSGWAFGPLVLVGIAGYTMYVNLLLTECYSMRPSRPTYSGLCESVLGYS